MEWQPIETAPKDGTRVLLFRPSQYPSATVVAGNFDSDRYASKPRPYWTHDLEILWSRTEARKCQPTHWMPLPKPPSA